MPDCCIPVDGADGFRTVVTIAFADPSPQLPRIRAPASRIGQELRASVRSRPGVVLRYLYRRALHAVLAVFVATILVFALLQLVPGDPIRVMASPAAKQEDIERLRRKWGLDQPVPVQYVRWITRIVRGDLGESVRMRVPVSEVLWPRYVNTFRLTLLSHVHRDHCGGHDRSDRQHHSREHIRHREHGRRRQRFLRSSRSGSASC